MRRVSALVLALLLAGCGGRRHEEGSTPLTFERLPDTSDLARGSPLLTHIEPYRMPSGAVRVRGEWNVPDGVRLQISIYAKDTRQMIGRVQVITDRQRFDTPPILWNGSPPPHGAYRFEYLALFDEAWQDPAVLRRLNDGRALRGPGITRDRQGTPAFYLVEERSL